MTDTESNPTPKASKASVPHARSRRPSRQISSTQVMFAVIVAVGLMLSINFSARITADRDLQQIRLVVVQEIEFLEREQIALIDELRYVESDAYVEAWARSGGKMIRPGEVLVLPVPSVQSAPILLMESGQAVTFDQVQTTLPDPEIWELWWALFFDTAPPEF